MFDLFNNLFATLSYHLSHISSYILSDVSSLLIFDKLLYYLYGFLYYLSHLPDIFSKL